jgi:hypothetical protein
LNIAGAGGDGRIVLEDDDGVISGQESATVSPGEGEDGFYRGPFDLGRFAGGGGSTMAITEPFLVGPFDPVFYDPVQIYPSNTDFLAEIPADSADPVGLVAILVEAQGFQMAPDGTPDQATATTFRTVGFFEWNGSPTDPRWRLMQVGAAHRPIDNTQAWGITNLNGCEYIQLRITFWMGPNADAQDLGPAIDRWTIKFWSDH